LTGFEPGPSSANITLSTLMAPDSSLLLAANNGRIDATDLVARALTVSGQGGAAQLFGEVGGIAGPAAAAIVFKSGQPESDYFFNDCVIATSFCSALPVMIGPLAISGAQRRAATPVNDFAVTDQQPVGNSTVETLGVGIEDLF
jgi:hypothetical protein